MTSLAEFFASIEPLLTGKIGAADFEARLGPSPSRFDRLGEYRRRARDAAHGVLESLYPATRRAASATRHGLWAALLDRFESARPATHFLPSLLGQPFPGFLRALALTGAAPDYLAQVADFEWLCFALAGTRRGAASWSLCDYRYDVVEYVADQGPERPQSRELTIVVYRSLRDGSVRILRPNTAERFVLEPRAAKPPAEPTARSITAAERRLVRLGVLPPA